MYFYTLKEVLKNKTVWVVAEKGEWYYAAVEVCFSKAEAEDFVSKHSPSRCWREYEIREQSIEEVLSVFDEETKEKTIQDESEEIAKRADIKLRLDIEREVEKRYNEKLKPIRDALDELVRRGA